MMLRSLDSRSRSFTKKFRGIDLTTAGVTAAASRIIFAPPPNTIWYVKAAYTRVRKVVGTVSDAPNILLDNGTDAQNIVAGVDLGTAEGAFKAHTIASTTLVVDNSNPLRLKSVDAADGATTFLVDLIVEVVQISN